MKTIPILLMSSLLIAEPLEFKRDGHIIKKVEPLKISTELNVKLESIEVWLANEKTVKKYQAFDFRKVLTAVYGKDWDQKELLILTCLDGYQADVLVKKVKQFQSYLAVGAVVGDFVIKNENKPDTPLGPSFLVWENIRSEALKSEDTRDWPFQITQIELANASTRFPNLSPPPGSSMAVLHGLMTFRQHCLACHSINGEGGSKAVDLNYPVSVTQYLNDKWLTQFITRPTSVRLNATMPSFEFLTAPEVKNLITYLKIMSKNRRGPKVESGSKFR